ncbi:FMRFamide receptor [Elysia marginata]|uniref:FMRFamide receptor n=1 Tax=Elysia marginata TaxID=1093978 RepID=A0AAV4EHX4_9GAST|nr:FMRFamide receptor [Elysia marginata]
MATTKEINLMVNFSYGGTDLSDENATNLTLFVLWGVLLPLVAAAGLAGNVLTMVVLWRKEMNSTTVLYMRGLVITDTGILLGCVISLSPITLANYLRAPLLDYFKDAIYPTIYAPVYYVVMLLQQINVWITVSVSAERYIAICHPFRAARLISKKKTLAAMLAITLLSSLYNLPHLFSTKTVSCAAAVSADTGVHSHGINVSSVNSTPVTALSDSFEYSLDTGEVLVTVVSPPSPTDIKSSPSGEEQQLRTPSWECLVVVNSAFGETVFFKFYRTIMYLLVIYVLPFMALLVLNTFLIRELMTMQKRNSDIGSKEENEANLSLVLILVVIVFILCQTPGLISQFDIISPSVFFTWLGVANLLFATNSAVNFLIYTAFGFKFRRVLLRMTRSLISRSCAKRRRRTYLASNCHAGLPQYHVSKSRGKTAVEMSPLPTKHDDVDHHNNGST